MSEMTREHDHAYRVEIIEKLRAEVDRLKGSVNPDMTNAQYHARLDRLWAAIPETEGEVFDLVVTRIAELERALMAWVRWQAAVRANKGNMDSKGALLRTALVLTKGALGRRRQESGE